MTSRPGQPQQQLQQHPMALPETLSPDFLDTVSDLAVTLERLQSILNPHADPSLPNNPPGQDSVDPDAPKPILAKDLPTVTDPLKHKLKKARTQVVLLPDMNRTIEDQQEEIADLEKRIRKQQQILEKFKAGGADIVSESQQQDS
ncbi:hypothetical protein Cpir12675_004332 [Ceratocystis pirilliformis]|uniref:Mediator of RNA polymerase II transcription subunit 9 n=1 Tax=Ceratocystis pirilliformis TaxID=259994 RepID=A0ABR3YXE2_9PEZI